MRESAGVRGGILRFYERFSAGDTDAFARRLSTAPGVSVIGTAPGEGHDALGFGTDTPRFVMPDGSTLPTRLTAVLRHEDGEWKVVHLHFSVGVADEDVVEPAS